jgi:hypothetical protein
MPKDHDSPDSKAKRLKAEILSHAEPLTVLQGWTGQACEGLYFLLKGRSVVHFDFAQCVAATVLAHKAYDAASFTRFSYFPCKSHGGRQLVLHLRRLLGSR